jgi:hypothetical protein
VTRLRAEVRAGARGPDEGGKSMRAHAHACHFDRQTWVWHLHHRVCNVRCVLIVCVCVRACACVCVRVCVCVCVEGSRPYTLHTHTHTHIYTHTHKLYIRVYIRVSRSPEVESKSGHSEPAQLFSARVLDDGLLQLTVLEHRRLRTQTPRTAVVVPAHVQVLAVALLTSTLVCRWVPSCS